MKKNITLAFLISFAVSIFAQDMTDAANFKRYADANSKQTDVVDVIFIGNSITEGWVGSNPQFFKSNNYLGRGISGQTSPQLLLRFRQDVINLHPSAVVINIGTNDIAENTGEYSPELTMDCIRSMAELAQLHGIKVILSSVLPASGFGWRPEITDAPQKIDILNANIESYAKEKQYAYIDYNTQMRNENGGLKEGLGRDLVHPSRQGYIQMESIAKPIIDNVLIKNVRK